MKRVRVWRITRKNYASDAFSGEGARLYGGRFNSAGYPAVYTFGSLSLALLESLVQTNNREFFSSCVYFYADIPESIIQEYKTEKLPDGWDAKPCEPVSQQFGDEWLSAGKYAVLKVPSAVLPVEWNYVLNPNHPDFSKVDISDENSSPFDDRLVL